MHPARRMPSSTARRHILHLRGIRRTRLLSGGGSYSNGMSAHVTHRVRRAVRSGLATLVLLAVLAGCGSSASVTPSSVDPHAKVLIVSDVVARALLDHGGNFPANAVSPLIYVTFKAGSPPSYPRPAGSELTAIYTSFTAFANDLGDGRFPRSARAALYDTEDWGQTPAVEQRDPKSYMAKFSKLARTHKLVPILAPARDLTLVSGGSCVKRDGETLSQAYLRCGLASADGQASVIVIQSQVDEFDESTYQHFVAAAARQARGGNAAISVVAELATAPLGRSASVGQLIDAARSVGHLVDGFILSARDKDTAKAEGLIQSLAAR